MKRGRRYSVYVLFDYNARPFWVGMGSGYRPQQSLRYGGANSEKGRCI